MKTKKCSFCNFNHTDITGQVRFGTSIRTPGIAKNGTGTEVCLQYCKGDSTPTLRVDALKDLNIYDTRWLDVNYCPICGRRLTDANSKN